VSGFPLKGPAPVPGLSQGSDSVPDYQSLYNGRIWQNPWYMIRGDQFLFSNTFLPGSLTMRGRTYTALSLKYDIMNDEVLIPFYSGGIMQVNKEMVDSFSIVFSGKKYRFVNLPPDSSGGHGGYFNVLHEGRTGLMVKHIKKIEKLSVEGKYDGFYEISKTYIQKDGQIHLIRNLNDALRLVPDKKAAREFMRLNHIGIMNSDPESYIPLTEFIDRLAAKTKDQ
jgi:hypothetical protein